jgi:hypothetical protein
MTIRYFCDDCKSEVDKEKLMLIKLMVGKIGATSYSEDKFAHMCTDCLGRFRSRMPDVGNITYGKGGG